MERKETWYEWDIESKDEHGDVFDHWHENRLKDLPPLDENEDLVLVRNYGDELDGLLLREWAYVKDGVLPTHFSEGAIVPERFHKEFAKGAK